MIGDPNEIHRLIDSLFDAMAQLNKHSAALRNLGVEVDIDKPKEPNREARMETLKRIQKAERGIICHKCDPALPLANKAEYDKHYYQQHAKKRERKKKQAKTQGKTWNPFPVHAKSTEAKRKAEAKTISTVECIPCRTEFPNIEALEEHQAVEHGVRFPKFG